MREEAVTRVMGILGLGEAGSEDRPLRCSPSSPAVSTPVGPPPAMVMLLAVGSDSRKVVQACRR